MTEPHLTTQEFRAEVAARLGRPVSRDRIAYAIRHGQIAAVRTGNSGFWYIPASEVDRYLVSNQERTP